MNFNDNSVCFIYIINVYMNIMNIYIYIINIYIYILVCGPTVATSTYVQKRRPRNVV